MPNLNCDESIAALLALLNPTSAPNFYNQSYDPSRFADRPKGPYTFEIYYNGGPTPGWYDFSYFYKPKSARIRDVFGFEPGGISIQLWDADVDFFNLPFFPISQMKYRVRNYNSTDTFQIGRIQTNPTQSITRRADGTETRIITINGLDLKGDFKRYGISERYVNATTYSVMKDVIQNHTPFDASEIDGTKGYKLTEYRIVEKTPAEVIQELLNLEINATFFLDPDTLKVYIREKSDPLFNVLKITDGGGNNSLSNVYDYFDIRDFFVNLLPQVLRNRVKFWFQGLYKDGTVACTAGGNHAIGTGTKFKTFIKPGGKFKIEGQTAEYTVNDVINDTDFTFSPNYAGSTSSGLSYSVYGFQDYVIVDDSASIATMAEILGDEGLGEQSGVFEVKMPQTQNYFTKAQARIKAQAYVNRMSQSLILEGSASTYNFKLHTAGLRAGCSMDVDLQVTRGINGTVIFQEIIWEEIGGLLDRTDTNPDKAYIYDGIRIDPVHKITFNFLDRRLLQENVTESIMQDIRDVRIVDDSIIELVKILQEKILIGDCVGIVPHKTVNETVEITDGANTYTVNPAGSYYTSPVGLGQTPAYTLSTTTYGFTV